MAAQQVDEPVEHALRALGDDRIDVERLCDRVDVDAGDHTVDVDPLGDRIQIDARDDALHVDPLGCGIQIDARDDALHVDPLRCGIEICPGHDAIDVDALCNRIEVDAIDDLADVDPVDDRVQVDPSDELVEVHAVQHGVDVQSIDDRVQVQTREQRIHVDALEHGIDVDAIDEGVDIDPQDEIVWIDRIRDDGDDHGRECVEGALEHTPLAGTLAHEPSVTIRSMCVHPPDEVIHRPAIWRYRARVTTATTTPAPVDDRFSSTDWTLFLSVAVIWGASFLFIDIGLDALPPGVITLLRVALGALALAVLPLPRRHTKILAEDRLRVVALSVIWVAVPFTLFPIAEQHISSAVAGLLNGGTPIFAAIFAMVLLRQPTRGAQLLGIVVGFAGVVFVSLPSIGEGASETLGVALVVLATVCYGFAVTLAGPLQQRYGSVNLMAKVLALATIWTAPYGLWQIGDASWELGPIMAVVVLGVIGTGIAFALMGTLVGRVGSTRASFITYLIPVVALVLGVVFRGDEVFVLELVGVVLVIGGALLASRRTASPR